MIFVATEGFVGLRKSIILVGILVSFSASWVAAGAGKSIKSCHNTETRSFCHRNKNKCNDPSVKWNCQRKCDVDMPGEATASQPWHVSLFKPGKNSPFCAGTLISDVHVLTAAHCVEGKTPEEFVVIFGDHEWTESSLEGTHAVKCIQNHYLYDSTLMDHDISLLTLNEKVDFGLDQQPACLPRDTVFKDRGMTLHQFTASGWGNIRSEEGHPISLNSLDLDYIKWRHCRKVLDKDPRKISWRTFCTSAAKREFFSTCAADGGGGIVIQDEPTGRSTVVGVASWGLGCSNKALGVHTDVRMQMDWITKRMEDQQC